MNTRKLPTLAVVAWAGIGLVHATEPKSTASAIDPPTELRGVTVSAGPTVGTAVRPYREMHALIIGINDYADDKLDLTYAVRDAEGVQSVLVERYDFATIRILRDAQATRTGVLRALADYRTLDENDALFIFWAGHGQSEAVGKDETLGYLVPYDGSTDPDEGIYANISMNELRDVIGKRVPAKHKFLVVDACYGGILVTRDAQVPRVDEAYIQEATREPVFQVLTAGRADQPVLDGGAGGHSVFTGRFIEALEDVQKFTTATALGASIGPKVRQDAFDRGQRVQTPVMGNLLGMGDFVFLRRGGGEPDPRILAANDIVTTIAERTSACPDVTGLARIAEVARTARDALVQDVENGDFERADAEARVVAGAGALSKQYLCANPRQVGLEEMPAMLPDTPAPVAPAGN